MNQNSSKLHILQNKGVTIPVPESVHIGDDVDPEPDLRAGGGYISGVQDLW